jgi:hypothetical protein
MIKIILVAKDENSISINEALTSFPNLDIYLISPNAKESKYNSERLKKINDNEIIDFEILRAELKLERFGWYYQQFLKYESVLKLDGKDFLILDGDTVVNPVIVKKDTLCTTNKPTVKNYYNLYRELFPNDKLYNKSFVTNQMVYNKARLKEMLNEIELKYTQKWINVIANLVKNDSEKMFSEYQTYAEYVLNRYENIKIIPIKVFRRMDLITDSIQNSLKKYDILAYEDHHKTGLLRKLRAKLFYNIGITIG